jgi:xylulokinase
MTKLIIGLDIGTTAAKAIVFTEDGMLIDQSREEYRLLFPHPGWAEQNPLDLWEGSKRALQRAIESLSSDQRRSITALSISSQRDTMVPTDLNGNPIRNAITWMDSRATLECKQLEETIGSDFIYQTTGVPVSTIWTGAFILWLKNNEPESFRNTQCFGLVHDYVLRQLGATDSFLDYSNACETMLYDIHKREWSSEILEALGITSHNLLPKLVASGTVVGQVSRSIENEIGLPRETLLVAGGGDQQCAALGAGAVNVGDIEIGIGTAANLLAVTNAIKLDNEQRLLCHEHVVPGAWVLEGALISAASTLSWVRDIAYSENSPTSYAQIDDEVEELSQPGAGGVLMMPHFEGAGTPYWDAKARGLYLGLSLSTSKADLARAVMEGIALEIGQSLEILREWGAPAHRAVITGGAGRSPVWAQIQANIYGIPVTLLKETDAAAVGAAILAGLGARVYENVETGIGQLVKLDKIFAPECDKTEMYELLSLIQVQAYRCLMNGGVYNMLSEFRERF